MPQLQPQHLDPAPGVPDDLAANADFREEMARIYREAEEAGALDPADGISFDPPVDESGTYFIGREFSLDEFRRWFAVQRLGGRPFNAVGFHHTEIPRPADWAGIPSLNNIFFKWFRDHLGWPEGKGPHLWVYSGEHGYSTGIPRIYVGTHPAHDGIGIDFHNGRYLHIEHIWNGDDVPFSDTMKRVAGEVLGIVCAPHAHADRQIPLEFILDGGVDNPGHPLGILYHRDENGIHGVRPKSCPGNRVTHENLDADLIAFARANGRDPDRQDRPEPAAFVAEGGSLVAHRGAMARPAPGRAGEGRQLTEGERCETVGYTDGGQDVESSPRWFQLGGGAEWIHASGGTYQPDSGPTPNFVPDMRQFTVAHGTASVRPGPSRDAGEPLRTLPAGTKHLIDGHTDAGQEIGGSNRWYRLGGNAGWVHASGFSLFGGILGNLPRPGGPWATLDGMNDEIAAAAGETGVPPHLIKAMLAREGSFGRDWGKPPVFFAGRPSEVLPFNGIFRSTAESRGLDFDKMCRERPYAIFAMGEVLRQIKAQQGFAAWDDVAGYYFAGPSWNNPDWGDELGNTVWSYKYHPEGGVIVRMTWLDGLGAG